MDLKEKSKQDLDDQRLISEGGENLDIAIANIYMRYVKDIRHHYKHKGLDSHTAEDLAHEIFVKVLENRETLKSVRLIGPWMWRIVFTNRMDYFRHKETKIKSAAVDEEALAAITVEAHTGIDEDLTRCVEGCWQQLEDKDPQRAYALRLAVMYEWDIEQLRGFLGKESRHATSEYLSQSRKKVKPCLQGCRELVEA